MEPTRGYLLDTITNERFTFQFNPEALEIGLGVEYSSVSPRGSSHARQRFKNGKGRAFSLELVFIRDTDDASDVEERRRYLESLCFPDYDGAGQLSDGPHPQLMAWGSWRSLRVVIESVKIAYGPAFDPVTLAPLGFTATIACVEVPVNGDVSREQVRAGG